MRKIERYNFWGKPKIHLMRVVEPGIFLHFKHLKFEENTGTIKQKVTQNSTIFVPLRQYVSNLCAIMTISQGKGGISVESSAKSSRVLELYRTFLQGKVINKEEAAEHYGVNARPFSVQRKCEKGIEIAMCRRAVKRSSPN
jgi:hypothetical protein